MLFLRRFSENNVAVFSNNPVQRDLLIVPVEGNGVTNEVSDIGVELVLFVKCRHGHSSEIQT